MKKLINEIKRYFLALDTYLNKQKSLDDRWKKEGPGKPLRYERGEFPMLNSSIKELSQEERIILRLFNELIYKVKNAHLLFEVLNPYLRERVYINDKPEKAERIFSNDKRKRAVMYTDIRGFTKATALKGSAYNTSYDLGKYFSEIFPICLQRNGQVEYLAGDAQIVSFANPFDALATAITTINQAKSINKDIGVGLNFGEVYYPDLGCEYYKVYTIIGDTVNMAQRMEELTKKFATPIIATLEFYIALEQSSKSRLSEVFYREFITDVEVRGAIQPKRLFDMYFCKEKQRSLSFYMEAGKELRKVKPDWKKVQMLLGEALSYYSEDNIAELYRNYARTKYQLEMRTHTLYSDKEIL